MSDEKQAKILKIDGAKAVETIYEEYLKTVEDHELPWPTYDDVPGQIKNLLQFTFSAGFGYCNHLLGKGVAISVWTADEGDKYVS